jgi:threonine dehydratase
VAQIGQHTFDICRHYVDEVITVSTDEICAAIKDIYDDTRSITEPAGAWAWRDQEVRRAARRQRADPGGHRLRRQRQLRPPAPCGRARRAGREARGDHRRDHPRAPGSFKAFCEAIGKRQITEFNYRYTPDEAHIFVGVQTHPENDPRSAGAA